MLPLNMATGRSGNTIIIGNTVGADIGTSKELRWSRLNPHRNQPTLARQTALAEGERFLNCMATVDFYLFLFVLFIFIIIIILVSWRQGYSVSTFHVLSNSLVFTPECRQEGVLNSKLRPHY